MRRFVSLLVVALLSGALSGGFSLIAQESCGVLEPPGTTHSDCPPTCLQCNCCRQPVLPGLPALVANGVGAVQNPPAADCRTESPDPADILHVPRLVA